MQDRILKTLKFFELQGVSPTLLELHRFLLAASAEVEEAGGGLSQTVPLSEVLQSVSSLVLSGEVANFHGHYALKKNESQIREFWLGHIFGSKRERRLAFYSRGLKYIPFLRGVALAGSQALGLQKKDSDIDLLVITKPQFMWLCRTLVTFYFHVLGVRRYGKHIADRFCLNHYLAGAKDLSAFRNLYTALEYGKLRPIVGDKAIFDFQQKNVNWIKDVFPNWQPIVLGQEKSPFLQRALEFVLNNKFGKWLDGLLCKIEKPRIDLSEKHIVVEEDELSFHPGSKQDFILPNFNQQTLQN